MLLYVKIDSDSLAAVTNLMTSARVNSTSLALMFSMMASGQEELINSALVYMAIHLKYTWFVFCCLIFHTDLGKKFLGM